MYLWLMANCYRCGRPVMGTLHRLRRRVRTGYSERVKYPDRRISMTRTTYGMRVVCLACAHVIDRQRAGESAADNWKLAVALVVLALVLLARFLGL